MPERALPALFAVAGGGLTRADLLALTDLPPDKLGAAIAAASSTGLGRAASRWTGGAVHVIADAGQRQRVTDEAGQRVTADCAAALHAWAESYRVGGWPDGTPEYLMDGYFRLLESTGDVHRMTACGTDRARHARLRALTGGDVAAVHEVAACQAALAAQDAPDLAAAAVLALLHDELSVRGDRLPTSLPATLTAAGDSVRADQLARSFAAPARRAGAFTGLALALLDEGRLAEARRAIDELVLTIAKLGASDEKVTEDAVLRLAAAGQWTSAERIARAAPSRSARVVVLRALVDAQIAAGHLDQAEHLALTLTSDDGGTDGYHGDDTGGADRRALIPVIAALAADGQGARAESLARAFPGPDSIREHGGVLALPHLVMALAATGQDEQFHRLVRAVPDERNRNRLLATATMAAPHDVDQAEEAARSVADDLDRAEALKGVVVRLLLAGDTERALSVAREIPVGPLVRALREKLGQSDTEFLLDGLGHHARPGVVRALVEQGQPDLAESFVSRISNDGDCAAASCELAVALAMTGNTARAEALYAEHRRRLRFDDSAVLKAVALTHLETGALDEALRTAHTADTPHLALQLLRDIAVWLVENGMTAEAERLAASQDDHPEMLATIAATAAAEGDAATARRLAWRAAELPQATPGLPPLRLLLLAEALVEGEEHAFACQLTERAVALVGTSNDVLLSRAAVVLARAGDLSRAETLARSFSFWSHREPALEAAASAYVDAGDVARAQSVVDAMDSGHEHKVRAMVAVATALTRAGDRDRARVVAAEAKGIAQDLSYGQGPALLAVIGVLLGLGDVAEAEQAVGAISGYHESEAARKMVSEARTEPVATDAPRRTWVSEGPGEVPAVVAEVARWLKEAGDEAGAARLLADAAEDARNADTSRDARDAEAGLPARVSRLLARGLCGIGRLWDFVLPSLAAVDRTVPVAVAEALGLDHSAPRAVDRRHGCSYAGLTADQLIASVVLCRRAGRAENPDLLVVLDELRRDYGHHACPFAASLERLAYGTHGPALFQEGMQPDEAEIVSRILEELSGGRGQQAP
ncbi:MULTISPECIES: hypothetical protein [unclassified Streptomyces]|uniref:hypothetical protein n=2 Tax=Streptomyces TaxID=1883 RepID=UPI001654CDFA|nr:hypothetical protein [Streptomyces sp. CB02980]MCB8905549.1 hypothetical protein [Streptomyces sp. CB02980]